MHVQIAPSILSADFARLADEAEAVADVADWLHVDVMDYHFVPNLTLGAPIVAALAKAASLPIDCHLMIETPERWATSYVEAGASSVTIHAEATRDPAAVARDIRAAGSRAGLALNPGTPLDDYVGLLDSFDMVLLMTVQPGFGGQAFRADVLPKVAALRRIITDRGIDLWLQVDGGVNADTIEACAEAGADVFVAGSAVYAADDPADAVRRLRAAAERAQGARP
ncbi:MAG: ribulose-5-phosphate 3-epimerase [Frankiales bacterium]|nr:ribulose-5-phosphate 3-epimerase [Frankiales bacterium]